MPVADHWVEGCVIPTAGRKVRNAALADSFRSSLLTAARKGEAFSFISGRRCRASAPNPR
jgi:hypothetical protein